jgi:hypothetical protein
VKNHSPLGPLERWKHKAVGTLLVIAFLPLILVVAIRAANEAARVIIELLGPLLPYAAVLIVLFIIYRLVIRRRW